MVRPRMRSAVLILALLLAVAGTGLSQQSVNRIVGEGIEALPYLTEATKASPQRVDVWANLLRAQFEVGDHLAALQTTERAMRSVPNDPRLAVALANLCLRHGELPKTRSLLEEANAANPREA